MRLRAGRHTRGGLCDGRVLSEQAEPIVALELTPFGHDSTAVSHRSAPVASLASGSDSILNAITGASRLGVTEDELARCAIEEIKRTRR